MSVLCDFYSSPWFSPAFFAERFNESLFQKAAAEVVRRIFYRADYDAQEQALQALLER